MHAGKINTSFQLHLQHKIRTERYCENLTLKLAYEVNQKLHDRLIKLNNL